MVKVITYGTYDLLHYGHIRLLERAKALGDYLIVGVTSDDYDKTRGKINNQQSLMERVAAVKATGIADEVIVEEYEGQKIDDIRRYGIDIFTVGSDWTGYFDYLNEYCEVVYLSRTKGISSTEIRSSVSKVKLGLVGYSSFLNKFYRESKYVNSIEIIGLCSSDLSKLKEIVNDIELITDDYEKLLDNVDAVYIHSHPKNHFDQCKEALEHRKHVICESPLALTEEQCEKLLNLADKQKCVLMEGNRTAYLTAYSRLLLLLKAGKIGEIASVDATCTSLSTFENYGDKSLKWGSLEAWGATALLPVFQILGTDYNSVDVFSIPFKDYPYLDGFTKLNFLYKNSTATVKVGMNIKSESELIVSGTKGYAYIPAPWWKTDYFELRYENSAENKRYFYPVEGEGIRYELVQLSTAIRGGKPDYYIGRDVTKCIAKTFNQAEDS
ncbi:Gfo/Idh/MocA family oxidoreductase [Ruminococcus albus]|uniref:Choline-phosphate cytidylyltransferase n=1 Tax=Ruminococcus albus TaxID=1264 RepID=A0A1I1CUR9_RUMAL|nr:Gfo/Idh/MocA family oxidoreductase [Ruminococcus albus]SFB66287.1 choline-phosphate cytidylyltransferase [Ruminococcus albus]